MDRRQQKTRQAIFKAFSELLEQKNYTQITVQEIIDKANVGRSTFYAHFETRDSLLKEMCADIFSHVFLEKQQSEKTHDFSDCSYAIHQKVTHILFHLRDSGSEIPRLLMGESGELFLNYFKSYLPMMFEPLLDMYTGDIPVSYLQCFLTGSFADTVKWWVQQGMKTPPEVQAEYYLSVIEHGIVR